MTMSYQYSMPPGEKCGLAIVVFEKAAWVELGLFVVANIRAAKRHLPCQSGNSPEYGGGAVIRNHWFAPDPLDILNHTSGIVTNG